jgi:2-hydroxy-3-keto-5-methylthiopentenyl-1-phosphate phosphatase
MMEIVEKDAQLGYSVSFKNWIRGRCGIVIVAVSGTQYLINEVLPWVVQHIWLERRGPTCYKLLMNKNTSNVH